MDPTNHFSFFVDSDTTFNPTGFYSGSSFPVQPGPNYLSFDNSTTFVPYPFSTIHHDPYFAAMQTGSTANSAAMHDGSTGSINIPHHPIMSTLVPDNQPRMLSFHNIGPEAVRPTGPIFFTVGDDPTGELLAAKKNRKCKNVLQMKRTGKGYKLTSIIKGQWTRDEDRMLNKLVERYGAKKWAKIGQWMPGRLGKQCRERWINHLQPNIKKDAWSEEEEAILIENHKKIGNRWAAIARKLPGRTDNTVKNHWNAAKRKQLDAKLRTTKPSTKKPKSSLLKDYIITILSPPPSPPAVAAVVPAGEIVSDDKSGGVWGSCCNTYDVFGSDMFGGSDSYEDGGFVGPVMGGSHEVGDVDLSAEMCGLLQNDVVGGGSAKKDMDLWEMLAERGWR